MHTRAISLLLSAAVASTACVGAPESTGSSAAAITNGDPAVEWQWRRTVRIAGCTGVLIGARWVLTAAHCTPMEGGDVRYYANASGYLASPIGHITSVTMRPGVDPSVDDYTDNTGRFADYAVLGVDIDAPSTSTVATMEWAFPGNQAEGYKVGSGRHNGMPNDARVLRYIADKTYSASDNDGHFLTEAESADLGDSGGGFFRKGNHRVLGVLYGEVFEWLWRNKYTSVPEHLGSILTTIGYLGSYTTLSTARLPSSPLQAFSDASERMCRYACDNTSGCVSITYVPNGPAFGFAQCYLASTTAGAPLPLPDAVSRARQ